MLLWQTVLWQAFQDLNEQDPKIRQNAVGFFRSPDLLKVLDYAGIDRNCAPLLRTRVLQMTGVPPRQRRAKNQIMHKGEAHRKGISEEAHIGF